MKARAAKLGLIADFINGYPFKPHQLGTVGQPVVRIRQLMDPSASVDYSTSQVPVENQIKNGDLIFAWSGSLAVKKWTRGPALLNQHLFKVVPHAGVDLDFLGYALEEVIPRLHAHGSTMQHVTRPELLSTQIQLPGLDQQRNIVDYLNREIAEMDAMNADLDALIETLTERRGRVSHHMLNALFSDAPLYPLWSILSPKKDQGHPDEQVLSVYRAYGVILKDSREDNNNRTPENVSSYQLVKPGDLVVNKMKAWQGSLGVSPHRGIVSPDYQVCRVISDNVDPDYLHVVLRSAHMVPQYRVRSKGVRPAQWRLYWENMAPLGIPLPSLDEQRRIVAELDASMTRIDAMVADAERLKALLAERKSTLITEAVTGRKEVPGA
ncbi:restriction endonuclease subunit S [Kocuria marina subsp. indica]|uniref:restriction endonuclease subunit S n=1 Tax=Kocuria marina TaxID=223184 RepID=UPI000EF17C97|nr:restriction endonuclease subunit S [Kocuria indica]RLP57322.1 restriction endonuclease subunit S [Kocuria indica]